jgi:hypothetical protein
VSIRALARAVALAVTAAVIVLITSATSSSLEDGRALVRGRIPAAGVIEVPVVDLRGIPEHGVGAVAVNVTATEATESSYLTVWPTGAPRPHASNLNVVAGQTVANLVIVPVGAGGKVSIFNAAGSLDVIVDTLGWFPNGPAYAGLTPARLLDTRVDGTTVDGGSSGDGPTRGGATVVLPVAGRGGVPPSGAGAAVLNVTVTEPSAASYLTVWPTGEARPLASNLTVEPARTVANLVIARLGDDGSVSLFNAAGTTHVVVDVMGWFPTGGAYNGVTPARLLDTRPGGTTVDGRAVGDGAIGGGTVHTLPVLGRGGVPAGAAGAAVAVNVTITDTTEPTALTVWTSGDTLPATSNVNAAARSTASNLAITRVGPDGAIALSHSAGRAEVVADVVGWFPATDSFVALRPARLLDTRPGGVDAAPRLLGQRVAVVGTGVPFDHAEGCGDQGQGGVSGPWQVSPSDSRDGQYFWSSLHCRVAPGDAGHLDFSLGGEWETFQATVGFRHDSASDLLRVRFRAYGDGAAEPLHEVNLSPGDPTTDFDFSVIGVDALRLEVLEVSGSTDVSATAGPFFGMATVGVTFQW